MVVQERVRRFRWAGGVVLTAAALVSASQAAPAKLTERIDAALAQLGKHTAYGVRVVSLQNGAVLYERNPDLSLNPASNMKLLTSTTALARLGPDYRFTTSALAAGKVEDGVLQGDLVLRGGGDPVLETPDLVELADAVKQTGLRSVRGGLIADDYRFDGERLGDGWSWNDEPYYYSAQISALNVNRGVMLVDITPGKEAGQPSQVRVKPVEGYVKVLEQPATGAADSRSQWDIDRTRGRNEIRVTGSVPAGGAVIADKDVTVEEPELYAAALFRKLLTDRGITIAGEDRRGHTPADAALLAAHASPPLSRIVALLNKPSDNLVAETLLKELGYTARQNGSSTAGATVVAEFLKSQGIDTEGVSIRDGSGLSRKDLITARVVSDLVIKADQAAWKDALYQSLPIAGVDGTLRSRFKGTAAERNVHAKTGSLSHVSALSGYVTNAAGERLAFSIVINNYLGATNAKRIEDAIAVALAESR